MFHRTKQLHVSNGVLDINIITYYDYKAVQVRAQYNEICPSEEGRGADAEVRTGGRDPPHNPFTLACVFAKLTQGSNWAISCS